MLAASCWREFLIDRSEKSLKFELEAIEIEFTNEKKMLAEKVYAEYSEKRKKLSDEYDRQNAISNAEDSVLPISSTLHQSHIHETGRTRRLRNKRQDERQNLTKTSLPSEKNNNYILGTSSILANRGYPDAGILQGAPIVLSGKRRNGNNQSTQSTTNTLGIATVLPESDLQEDLVLINCQISSTVSAEKKSSVHV